MKLESVTLARSVWTIDSRLLNPFGKSVAHEIIPGLQERYRFVKVPSPEQILSASGERKFALGVFSFCGENIHVELSMYSDALVADTTLSTEASDEFLDDVLAWISGLTKTSKRSELVKQRTYRSELVVRAGTDLFFVDRSYTRVINAVSNTLATPLAPIVLHFGSDSTSAAFTIERRLGSSIEENLFFSSAQLSSSNHLTALEMLEEDCLSSQHRP